MNERTLSFIVLIAVVIIPFFGLTILSEPARGSGPTFVGGPIQSNTTWTEDQSPIIVGENAIVGEFTALTIEAGVVVKFNSSKALVVDGSLRALGSSIDPIIFTSNIFPPKAGDWSYIKLNSAENEEESIIRHAEISYSVYGIWCVESSPRIESTTIFNVESRGIYLEGSDATVVQNIIKDVPNRGIDAVMSGANIVNNTLLNITNYAVILSFSNATLSGNTIADTIEGVYSSHSTIRITDNEVSASGDGLYLEHSGDSTVRGCVISGSEYGIHLVFSNRTSIESTSVSHSAIGIYVVGSSFVVGNSTIRVSLAEDIFLTGVSVGLSINTSLASQKVAVAEDSTLRIQNYIAVETRDISGYPIAGATVIIEEDGTLVYSGRTGLDGMSEWILVTAQTFGGAISPISHTVTARVSFENKTFEDNPRNADMTVSHIEYFEIMNEAPIVEISSPGKDQTVAGSLVVSGGALDVDGEVIAVFIKIDTGDWQSCTNVTHNWSSWMFEWNTTLELDGEHKITSMALDDRGGHGFFWVRVIVENEAEEGSQESLDSTYRILVLLLVIIVLSILLAFALSRRKKAALAMKEERSEVEPQKGNRVEKSLLGDEVRIGILKDSFMKGRISEEVYKTNLAKLGSEDSGFLRSSADQEEFSYVCPMCSDEVDADATECPSCGAVFEN